MVVYFGMSSFFCRIMLKSQVGVGDVQAQNVSNVSL